MEITDVVFFEVRGTIPQISLLFAARVRLHKPGTAGKSAQLELALPHQSPEALHFALAMGAGQSPSERLGLGTPDCHTEKKIYPMLSQWGS